MDFSQKYVVVRIPYHYPPRVRKMDISEITIQAEESIAIEEWDRFPRPLSDLNNARRVLGYKLRNCYIWPIEDALEQAKCYDGPEAAEVLSRVKELLEEK